MDVDRPLLLLKMKKMFRYILLRLNFFTILKLKVIYLRPFLTFLSFPKIWKENFMYLSHKYVET